MLATALAVLLGACASADPPASPGGAAVSGSPAAFTADITPAPIDPSDSADPVSAEPVPSAAASPDAGVASAAPSANPAADALAAHPWATATLTDVTTGETFTIADLAGKPVFIEAMAIWCTNCRQQQARFTEAFGQLLPGTAEYVVLTIDPSENAKDLARYEAERGFSGRYVVAGRDLSRQLEAAFGPNILNPPSVPLVFVSRSGEIEFRTGPEPVERIVERAGA
jgi:thiol-disulfide isomerase/thioredoxin